MAKIYLSIPNEGWVRREVTASVLAMSAESFGHQTELDLIFERPIDHARNLTIKRMLENDAHFDYLFFMDSDNPFVRNPMELVDLDKDILAFPTPVPFGKPRDWAAGRPMFYFNCMDWLEEKGAWTEHHPQRGLQEIHAAGTGCMLIARRVLEAVRPAFIRVWDEDGLVEKGSDFWFCKRARDAGFKVWAHYDYPCQHFKELDMLALNKHQWIRDIRHASGPNINTPEYWNEQWAKREERVLPFYDEIVKRTNGGAILDYGCGRGDLLALLGPNAVGMDISDTAVDVCRRRGLKAMVGDTVEGRWDTIVCTEVLEHLDDDVGKIREFFEHTDRVIFSVPNNCLPPSIEPEHRRVYTQDRLVSITPHLKEIINFGHYVVVVAEKE